MLIMKSALSATRRRTSLQWVCYSCRSKQAAFSSAPCYEAPLSKASQELRKNGPARTRFAPSPTGYLHLGSMRTALFNYLISKATGGQFLLRIEDTDQKRTVHDAENSIYRDLEWAGIECDEGPNIGGPFGPYKQSERTAIYRKHVEHLLHSGHAYRCFCSPEDLQSRGKHRVFLGLPPDYDRTCAHIPKEEADDRAAKGDAHVVRLFVPDKYPIFNDLVYGLVRQRKEFASKTAKDSFDDPILLKSDGFPTYHLANVVDDHLMEISHVIRGSEWMSSTPQHLALYQAFGWTPPQFAHVGLLLDQSRQKLSKRLKNTNLKRMRDEDGIFPETLTNFVALLGWSHRESSDVMSMKDLIENASLKFTKGDTVVALEKLWFLQKRHAARYASEQPPPPENPSHDLSLLALQPILTLLSEAAVQAPEEYSFYISIPESLRFDFVHSILWADAQNYRNPQDFMTRHQYFFRAPTHSELHSNPLSPKLHNIPSGITHTPPLPIILKFFSNFGEISRNDWNKEELKSWLESIIDQGSMQSIAESKGKDWWTEELDIKVRKSWGKLVHGYVRWAVMGGAAGPDGAETMRILGRGEVLERLKRAAKVLVERAEKVQEEEGEYNLDG